MKNEEKKYADASSGLLLLAGQWSEKIEKAADQEKIEILKGIEKLHNIDIEKSMQNFVRNTDKFEVYCKNGHIFLSKFGDLKRGHSCIICSAEEDLKRRKNNFLSKLKEREDFEPDYITVAYGTNDWKHYQTLEEGRIV